ncbi:MAG: LuxR C-terminal-related transcriptional regulator, partial [Bacteroidota bacterium]
ILLTDVMMPKLPGNQLAKQVREKYPNVKILALSMSGQGDLVNEMIEDADIAGYVLKNIGKQELVKALEKIAGGGIYFSEEVLDELQRSSNRKKQKEEAHLTGREVQIIRLIEKEYNNKQIAETLFISERTVETHRKNIFRKTSTNSVIGLVKYAYEHKLI